MPEFQFEFSGIYSWGDVITSLCGGGYCRVSLPREFYNLSVPLSVYENTFENAFKALALQAKADGWILSITSAKKKEQRLVSAKQDVDLMASYVSCLDTVVKSVKASELYRHRYADSLRCYSRARSLDSLASLRDSLFYPTKRYRVSFYVVTSAFLRSLGVDWTTIWAQGDLHSIPDFITDWALRAVASDDTTAEFRSLELDVDSIATLHWGSQKKEEKSMVVYANGVAQNDWEWRDYGLTLNLSRDVKNGLRADYQLAQRDENNSILRGNFGGGGSDSIVAFGVYDSYQNTFSGIPWLYKVPLIGYLFGSEHRDKVKSFFVIQVYSVQPDSLDYQFPRQDSLRLEDVKQYERLVQDSTDDQLDTLDREED